ncbi:10943_t:CDS:2 [Funneliformis caledonium]|uniref:10943_t:CDS:1 n=1 Tax=Funneliformis caledonium TaxID=1117310 RepID=A0A9N9GTK2_9GLOM|nr:10943_t:CDS:2 [Funneliformis caledonium]
MTKASIITESVITSASSIITIQAAIMTLYITSAIPSKTAIATTHI